MAGKASAPPALSKRQSRRVRDFMRAIIDF